MNKIVAFCFLFLFFSSCKKDFELGNNIFDTEENIVVLESVSFENANVGYKNVKVYFDPVFLEKINENQKAKITGYQIYKNGVERFRITDKDINNNYREWFYDTQLKTGSNICYQIAIITEDGKSKKSSSICISIPN